jgi:hypothetical protein
MAIILYQNADKTVDDIAARNALPYKINNMVVTVLDAISDPDAGTGVATYRYNESINSGAGGWILISKSTTDTMSFDTEELTIASGEVTASNIPVDNQIWDVHIVDGDVIIADIREEDLTVSAGTISGLGAYDGYKLRFTYAYGSVTSQITSYVDGAIADVVGGAGVDDDTLAELAAQIDALGSDAGTVSDFEAAL